MLIKQKLSVSYVWISWLFIINQSFQRVNELNAAIALVPSQVKCYLYFTCFLVLVAIIFVTLYLTGHNNVALHTYLMH